MAEVITGLWVNPRVYKMHSPRTGKTRVIAFLTDDAAEKAEWVSEAKERFEEDLKGISDHHNLDKTEQHDLGGVLTDIRASQKRRAQVGHGRWW